MEYLGIDVQKVESQICILTESGEVVERRIRTQRERFAAVLGERPRAKILIEASTESECVTRCLEELGHEVEVGDRAAPGGVCVGRSAARLDRWAARATCSDRRDGGAALHGAERRPGYCRGLFLDGG